jgi:hypothetical protein
LDLDFIYNRVTIPPASRLGLFMNTLKHFRVNGIEVLLDKGNKNISIAPSNEKDISKQRQVAVFKYLSEEGFLDDEEVFDNKKGLDNDDELW